MHDALYYTLLRAHTEESSRATLDYSKTESISPAFEHA